MAKFIAYTAGQVNSELLETIPFPKSKTPEFDLDCRYFEGRKNLPVVSEKAAQLHNSMVPPSTRGVCSDGGKFQKNQRQVR